MSQNYLIRKKFGVLLMHMSCQLVIQCEQKTDRNSKQNGVERHGSLVHKYPYDFMRHEM